ncbi:hypothetical protein [Methylobacterium durans]|uniref:hypothetical protein n=1 Tax=Methylobacterium durans TaxID=2202825 RepID=UPI001F48CA8D|nr:hypothetical protein [Methylobacterium durans]
MLRLVLLLALLAMPGAVAARPAQAPKVATAVTAAAPAPVCERVRKKSFQQAEGWSVKTVSLACKMVTAVVSRPGGKSFTSLREKASRKAKQ